ncbi:MAG: hypothetical protein H0X25_17500 [Acidobacteriales bacterium]|nr:hypothetical protein [Terriglobales bacterium]
MSYNRTRRRELPLRQEFMAHMLGVHRPTVPMLGKSTTYELRLDVLGHI